MLPTCMGETRTTVMVARTRRRRIRRRHRRHLPPPSVLVTTLLLLLVVSFSGRQLLPLPALWGTTTFPPGCLASTAEEGPPPSIRDDENGENDDIGDEPRPGTTASHQEDGTKEPSDGPSVAAPPPPSAGPILNRGRRRYGRQTNGRRSVRSGVPSSLSSASMPPLPQFAPKVFHVTCGGSAEGTTTPWIRNGAGDATARGPDDDDDAAAAGALLPQPWHRGTPALLLAFFTAASAVAAAGFPAPWGGGGGISFSGVFATDLLGFLVKRGPDWGGNLLRAAADVFAVVLPRDFGPSLVAALLVAWVPTLLAEGAWWELSFLLAAMTVGPTGTRTYVGGAVLPALGRTVRKLALAEAWRHAWDVLLRPFPRRNLLVPSLPRDDDYDYDGIDGSSNGGDTDRRTAGSSSSSSLTVQRPPVGRPWEGEGDSWMGALSRWNRYWYRRVLARMDRLTSSLLRGVVERQVVHSLTRLLPGADSSSWWWQRMTPSLEVFILSHGGSENNSGDTGPSPSGQNGDAVILMLD